MRRPSYLSYVFVISLIFVLALTACTRPVPGSDTDSGGGEDSVPPTTVIVPTTAPETQPDAGTDTGTDTGTEAPDSGDTGQEGVAPDSGGDTDTTTPPEDATSPDSGGTDEGSTDGTDTGETAPPDTGEAPEGNESEASQPESGVDPTTPPMAGEERVHVVQTGETLFRISYNSGCDMNEVAAYNSIPIYYDVYGRAYASIYAGDIIRIPPNCQ